MAQHEGLSTDNPVSRETGGSQPSDVLYKGRAEVIVEDTGKVDTGHLEAFCLYLLATHNVAARPGVKARYSKAWPEARIQALYAEWKDS